MVASRKEQSLWEFTRSLFTAAAPEAEVALPMDKLACKRASPHAPGEYRPVVLVSCGSVNPPTCMHLRMFELASQHLAQVRRLRPPWRWSVHDTHMPLAACDHALATRLSGV